MFRYKIIIEYDGTNFCGWQRQKDALSVQEVIEKALFSFCGVETETYAAGRTDAGVHAMAQTVHFDLGEARDTFRIKEALNALVRPHAVGILDCTSVDDDFHARFSAKERGYMYKILNRRTPAVLDKNRVWQVPLPLDVEKMQMAANLMIGKHDFTTFRSSECQAHSPVKTLNTFDIEKSGDLILCKTTALSFLHHQVRNMVGTLVQVGQGNWTLDDFKTAFVACDRTKGGPTAPPDGLYMTHVLY